MKFGGRAGPRREQGLGGASRSIEGPQASAGSIHTPGNQALIRSLGAGASSRGLAAGRHGGLGNQALARLRRRGPEGLRLGAQDDRFEREAHAVADAIVAPTVEAGAAGLQIQRIGDASGVGLREVPPGVEAAISGARGGGRRLPEEVAATIGPRLGADLEGVRVHTDDRAHALSGALHARAFTTGSDIFFGRGQYDPASGAGRKVLAHELTHVVQQRGRGGGRSERGPIQRFVMQVGVDDGYTETMSKQLLDANKKEEGFLQFKAAWDKSWLGLATYGTYAPTSWHKPKGSDWLPSHGPSKKLKGVPDGEKLRIVGHGNIHGQIGGYSGEEMGGLLLALGLPQTHTGGVDVHGCLPASNWKDDEGNVHGAHIVALEDFLAEQEVKDVVRGYEHCIFPDLDAEVASSAYGFFEVARAFNNLPKGTEQAITEAQEKTIRRVMGDDADNFIDDVTRGTDKVINGLYFFHAARQYLERKGLMQRAELVDTAKARAALKAD